MGRISVSVIVKSGVMSIQPSADKFAGVNNKSRKSTAIGVAIFVFARSPRAPFERYILLDCILRRQAVGTGVGTGDSTEASCV